VDNERWPAFLGGLILGVLVTLGLVGTFGWHKFQQARAQAEVQAAEAMMQAERAREMEAMARMQAEEVHRHAEKRHEALRKQVDEVLKTVGEHDPKDLADVRAKLREAVQRFRIDAAPGMKK
jgi:uncharacterized protein HemX